MDIKMGWITYEIKFIDRVLQDGEEVDGLFIPREKLILVDKNLPEHIKRKVLFHELLHALLFSFGRDEWTDENLINCLTIGMMSIIAENKEKVSKLLEDLEETTSF